MFVLRVILGTTETARVVKETGQFFYWREYYLRENDQSWTDFEYKNMERRKRGCQAGKKDLSRVNEGWGLCWWHNG